ncbi:ATP-binding protein [Streptomyces cylindrosporus]|uniref:ATP-binding protein n=1 Tax=Streptomyces cylindrosporus TaxID=2927583 RepID=A0ABS9Y8P1_9ACTN|nr:ATP-binding protein [Streptomyces cylindrosporus]MCI3273598.1 ATP-binding protein [Streptomyces cylindrosporus]
MSLPAHPAPWFDPAVLQPGRAAAPGVAGRVPSRTAQLRLPSERSGCGQARAFTERVLTGWELDHCLDDALTIVSELTANALLHAVRPEADGETASEVRLRLTRRPAHLVCAVTDQSPSVPTGPHTADPLQEHGRGLFLVEALAQHWGWTRTASTGKTVWAMLPTERG